MPRTLYGTPGAVSREGRQHERRILSTEDFARHPLRDEPSPEAELLHQKMLESLIEIDTADEEIHRIYNELGRTLVDEEE